MPQDTIILIGMFDRPWGTPHEFISTDLLETNMNLQTIPYESHEHHRQTIVKLNVLPNKL